MRRTFFLLALVCLLVFPFFVRAGTTPPSRKEQAEETDAPAQQINPLIRVNATGQAYDFFRPWMKRSPIDRRGLGVILKGGLILTTAELVANNTYVELEKSDTQEKCPAIVVKVDYDCNLALLKPSTDGYLDASKAVSVASGAKVGDHAEALQLEENGQVARTPAVITTIIVARYPYDSVALLIYKLNLPLQQRQGSFTIPVAKDGALLGLLMRYDSHNQTGELIPPPVINHFLAETAQPKYRGIPRLGLTFASTRDPQLRRYVGLDGEGGVYVTGILPGSAAEKAGLRKGDVLLSMDGKPIDEDGNYDDSEYGRISFSYLACTTHYPGDTMDVTILRDGKKQTVPVVLGALDSSNILSEAYIMDRQPKFYILDGLVFQELSREYLEEWGNNWEKEAPQKLVYLDAFQDEVKSQKGDKIVFLSQVLPAGGTLGYENLENLVVTKVNGQQIHNLNDLAEALKTPVNGFDKIEFNEDPGCIYLDANQAVQDEDKLRKAYGLTTLQHL